MQPYEISLLSPLYYTGTHHVQCTVPQVNPYDIWRYATVIFTVGVGVYSIHILCGMHDISHRLTRKCPQVQFYILKPQFNGDSTPSLLNARKGCELSYGNVLWLLVWFIALMLRIHNSEFFSSSSCRSQLKHRCNTVVTQL